MKAPIGDKLIPGKQMGGTFSGNTVTLQGQQSKTELTMEGDKLVG